MKISKLILINIFLRAFCFRSLGSGFDFNFFNTKKEKEKEKPVENFQ